jgi:hypothetical protein
MPGERESREAGGAMVNRRLLRWGVFLLALGGVLLLGQAGALEREAVRVALGLWPLALIAIGAAILLRATPAGLAAGVAAAALPGLLLGGLFVALPDVGAHCRSATPSGFDTRQGSFDGTADVELRVACGELTVTTMPGTGWETRIGQGGRPIPEVASSSTELRVGSARQRVWFGSSGDGDLVEARLPTEPHLDVDARVDAGQAHVSLRNATLGRAAVAVNAGGAKLDLTGATLSQLSIHINAGDGTVVLPAADFDGSLEVNGGELRVCVPEDLGLRIHEDVSMGSIGRSGLRSGRDGSTWESDDYAAARYHAELTVEVNVGSVEFNPQGGCQ